MVGRWGGILFVLLGFLSLLSGQEEFRIFTASSGQAFSGRVLSYEGQTFYIEGKDKKLYPVPFKQLSAPDQKYLIEIALAGKIPKGDPRTLKQDSAPAEQTEVAGSVEQQGEAKPKRNEKVKPSFRPGSFFAYKPVNLGQDPLALAAENVSVLPGPGEAIDFKQHVLPIMEERCFSCHNAPYDKNGRTIHPKAGLRLDTHEWVMKGNLDNTVVEAGNLADSYLYEVVTLDEDDDMFMPPKGGPLSPEQIDVLKRWIEEGAKASSGGGAVASSDMSNGISFHDHIFPLIEERCLDCHSEPYVKNGRTIHPKAGLRLDTYESIIEGNLDGTIVEKGNADESTLYAVITLDSDDPEIMPPKGDPLTEEEINMFKQWIIEGAKENPTDTFEQPKEELTVSLEANSDQKEISIVDQLAKRLKAPSKPQMEAAQKSGALVTLLSTRHSMVRAEFSSGPNLIKDDAIGALSSIKNNVSHLDLSRTSVTDSVLGEVKKFNNLTWLNLKNTSVTDRGIQSLSKMPYLTYLNLVSSKITDNSINTLASLKTLEEVYLWNSDVSARGVSQLRKALPHAKILH
jgi:hypothetical protein